MVESVDADLLTNQAVYSRNSFPAKMARADYVKILKLITKYLNTYEFRLKVYTIGIVGVCMKFQTLLVVLETLV